MIFYTEAYPCFDARLDGEKAVRTPIPGRPRGPPAALKAGRKLGPRDRSLRRI